jgi:hypothetical protein
MTNGWANANIKTTVSKGRVISTTMTPTCSCGHWAHLDARDGGLCCQDGCTCEHNDLANTPFLRRSA